MRNRLLVNVDKENWIEDCVERAAIVVRKRVEHTSIAI